MKNEMSYRKAIAMILEDVANQKSKKNQSSERIERIYNLMVSANSLALAIGLEAIYSVDELSSANPVIENKVEYPTGLCDESGYGFGYPEPGFTPDGRQE